MKILRPEIELGCNIAFEHWGEYVTTTSLCTTAVPLQG